MKPGDLIEWHYKNNDLVVENEMLRSSLMKQWVPIGIVSIVLHKNDKTYSWINSKGCFRARVKDRLTLVVLYGYSLGVSIRVKDKAK